MISKRLALATGVALVLGLAGCGGTSEDGDSNARAGDFCKPLSKTEKVTLGASPSLGIATSLQAQGGGYYDAEKLDVDSSAFNTGQDVIALVGRGQLDAALVGFSANLFSAIDQGVDVRVVSSNGRQTAEHPSTAVYVRSDLIKDGTVKDISDLKGLKFGFPGSVGSAGSYYSGLVLKEGGLSLDDVEQVPLAPADTQTAFQTKSIDAALAVSPFTTALDSSGVAQSIDSHGVLADQDVVGLVLGPNLLDKRPEVGCALLRANVEAARKELAPGYSKDPEVVQRFVDLADFPKELVQGTPEYVYDNTLAVNEQTIKDMQEVFIDQGALPLKAPLAYDKVVDTSFHEAMVASLDDAAGQAGNDTAQ
jgi:NitT/TauT family transport system substrate-binding protein